MQLQHLRQHLNTWKQDSVCKFGGVRANRARDSGLFRMVLRPNYNPIRESEGKSNRDVEDLGCIFLHHAIAYVHLI